VALDGSQFSLSRQPVEGPVFGAPPSGTYLYATRLVEISWLGFSQTRPRSYNAVPSAIRRHGQCIRLANLAIASLAVDRVRKDSWWDAFSLAAAVVVPALTPTVTKSGTATCKQTAKIADKLHQHHATQCDMHVVLDCG
jgi:hypothetical protein